jgi:hypothetical protein
MGTLQRIGAETGKIGDLNPGSTSKIQEIPQQAAKVKKKPPRQQDIMAGAASG